MRKTLMFVVCVLMLAFPVLAQDATPSAAEEPVAFIRFANFAPGASVDFFMDDQLTDVHALEYKAFSDWAALPAGSYTLSASTSGDEAAQGQPADVDFAQEGFYTIAATGADDGSVAVNVIEHTLDQLMTGTSWITFVNAVQGDTNVDIVRDDVTYTADLFPLGNAEGQTSWFGILDDVDTYNFRVVENGNPDNVLVEAPD